MNWNLELHGLFVNENERQHFKIRSSAYQYYLAYDAETRTTWEVSISKNGFCTIESGCVGVTPNPCVEISEEGFLIAYGTAIKVFENYFPKPFGIINSFYPMMYLKQATLLNGFI